MADQITTVSVLRLRRRMGLLGPNDIQGVERVVRLQLSVVGRRIRKRSASFLPA